MPSGSALVQQRVKNGYHAIPFSLLGDELTTPGLRETVEPCVAVVVGNAPVPAKKPTLFQAHERRIQRSHIESEDALRDLFQPSRERVAVKRPERSECLQDHQVERA